MSDIDLTAVQKRNLEFQRRLAFDMLCNHPHLQAGRIADHYMAHAETARQLHALIEAKRNLQSSKPTPSHDAAIQYIVDTIKTNHRCDLGIELEWPKTLYTDQWLEAPSVKGERL